MNESIRVLLVEDSESDAALVVRHLEKAGFEVRWQRAETASAMRGALGSGGWDVVISDYTLPEFEAWDALDVLREAGADIPFIVVSGKIGEETAVRLMKAGAHDFLKKDSLTRLGPVVGREIAEAREHALRRRAEAALREAETRFQTLVEMAPEAILIETRGQLVYANAAAQRLVGASSLDQLLGHPLLEFIPPRLHERVSHLTRLVNEDRESIAAAELLVLRVDGSTIHVEASAVPFRYEGDHGALVFARDISERKRSEAALAEQIVELRRWNEATLGRESRILELKREVNELLVDSGQPPRYGSAARTGGEPEP